MMIHSKVTSENSPMEVELVIKKQWRNEYGKRTIKYI